MKYSNQGLHLTAQFESCRLYAYQDQRGIWTIGYGHTNGVKAGDVCTVSMAESWLRSDAGNAEASVNCLVKVQLSQGEFDALVDFVFNIGATAFRKSTLLMKLNASDFMGAAAEFEKWDHVSGQVCKGLFLRREYEVQEFDGTD